MGHFYLIAKSFLVIILLTEIIFRASTQQGLLFRQYKCHLTRNVNAENAARQASRSNIIVSVECI